VLNVGDDGLKVFHDKPRRAARALCPIDHEFQPGVIFMRRHASMSAVEIEWTFVSAKHPCPICAGKEGCRRSLDDEFACCTRASSIWPLASGGWVHRVSRFSRATSVADLGVSHAQ
jgi:hypothetical protein